MRVRAQASIFGDQAPSALNRSRIDEAVSRIAWKGLWQGDRRFRYPGRYANRTNLSRETI